MASANSIIERLPMELRQGIMKYMDANTLLNFICTSKNLRGAFLDNPGFISHTAIENEIGADILPLAAARYKAEHHHFKARAGDYYLYENRAIEFIESNISLQGLKLMTPPAKFSLGMICELSPFHAMVTKLAEKFIEDSSKAFTDVMKSYPITPAEKLRFIKAFYIYDLLVQTVPIYAPRPEQKEHSPFAIFWKKFAPWECFQVNNLEAWLNITMHRRIVEAMANELIAASRVGCVRALNDLPAFVKHQLHINLRDQWNFLNLEDVEVLRTIMYAGYDTLRLCPCSTNERRTRYRLWLHLANTPPKAEIVYHLNPMKILEKYPYTGDDSDSGPQDIWFFSLMRWAVPIVAADFPQGFLEVTEVTFPFWSRQRWVMTSSGQIPTMEEMVSAVSDSRVCLSNLQFPGCML